MGGKAGSPGLGGRTVAPQERHRARRSPNRAASLHTKEGPLQNAAPNKSYFAVAEFAEAARAWSDSLYGARATPRSVKMAAMYWLGVTSKAGWAA